MTGKPARMRRLSLGVSLAALLSVACGGPRTQPSTSLTPAALIHGTGTVRVMYAASLTTLFEKKVGQAYNRATGFSYQGEGKGSVAIATNIKDRVRTPDVFVSADPTVNTTLQGPSNGNYVSWWASFARTEMVIGWSPQSKFAADFRAARSGRRTWESVLEQPGLKLGRTDPETDPKGYRTLFLFQLDEQRTNESGVAQKVLGSAGNSSQIFPEEQLVARLQAGDLDAGIFYTIEAIEADLPYLTLPPAINQGDPAQAGHYATVSYTSRKGRVYTGSPILYTATVPGTATNIQGAQAFVQYLLSRDGQALLAREGLLSTPPLVGGDAGTLPSVLKPFVKS